MPKDNWAKAKIRDKIRKNKVAVKVIRERVPYWDTHNLLKTKCWFGKYKGWLFEDIPTDYLIWLVNNSESQPLGFTNKLRSILKSFKLL